jgi:hypothetical protein
MRKRRIYGSWILQLGNVAFAPEHFTLVGKEKITSRLIEPSLVRL